MNNSAINASYIRTWMNENLTPKAVEETLISGGYDQAVISEYLVAYNKQKREKKQLTGFVLMFIGGFIGFIACVLTLFNIFPDLHDTFLFGFTTVAICIAFYGLYIVFES